MSFIGRELAPLESFLYPVNQDESEDDEVQRGEAKSKSRELVSVFDARPDNVSANGK